MKQAIMKETKINTSRDFFLVLPSFLPFELSFTPTSWLVRASCTRPSPAADTHTGPSDHATCCHGEAGWVGGLAVRVGPRALGRTVHSFHRHPSRQPVLYDASCPVLACPRLPSPSLPWFCLAAPPLNLPPTPHSSRPSTSPTPPSLSTNSPLPHFSLSSNTRYATVSRPHHTMPLHCILPLPVLS